MCQGKHFARFPKTCDRYFLWMLQHVTVKRVTVCFGFSTKHRNWRNVLAFSAVYHVRDETGNACAPDVLSCPGELANVALPEYPSLQG